MAIAALAVLAAAPAAAQTAATVTTAAEREAHVLGLDDVAFVPTRSGSTETAFAPDDFTAAGGIWEARKDVPVGILDGTAPCGADGCAARATIRDNDVAEPAAIAGIEFVSPAETYAIGDEVRASVAFDKPVTATATAGAMPYLELDIGGAARRASYRSGSGSTALVFAYEVAEGDADSDGVSVGADRLTAPPGSAIAGGGVAASLTHPAVAADPTRKVDGVRPTARFATVDRGRVVVNWDETLTIEEGPGIPGGFVAIVGGAPGSLAAVGVNDRQVSLALYETVGDAAWVTLSYAPPDVRPIRDAAGNRAAGFSLTVTAGERGICRRSPVARGRIMVLLRHAVRPGHSGDFAGVPAIRG